MRKAIHIISLCMVQFALCVLFTACNDKLNTEPEDYFGASSYWQTPAQVEGFMQSIANDVRGITFNHTIRFGELGAGIYRDGLGSNGNQLADVPIRLHKLGPDVPGVASWGGYYSAIADVNLFIQKVEEISFMEAKKKEYLLAQAYGLRAMYYFDLYRIYGGVPLRLKADVASDGVSNVDALYMARSTASATLAQIMADVRKSIELFGTQTDFNPYGMGDKCYWNKAASQCLAAEVLLWSAKVSTGDAQANPSEIDAAETLLKEVEANYGLSLQQDFAKVFATDNKANDEVIFAVRYAEGEALNDNAKWLYPTAVGFTVNDAYDVDGNKFGDRLQLVVGENQVYEYIPEMFLQYDADDSRALATFTNTYKKDDAGNLVMEGNLCTKNIGNINSAGMRVMSGDYIYYRLAWVYLTLAEIYNYKGDNAKVKEYVDKVRARAYKNKWNETLYGFTAADFGTNELAILAEKDKEFIQEGQRWWDLRRMQLVKGDESTHLIFRTEASKSGTPVLTSDNAFRTLWPISTVIRANDPLVEQNPGY